jgi:hypothetical protein
MLLTLAHGELDLARVSEVAVRLEGVTSLGALLRVAVAAEVEPVKVVLQNATVHRLHASNMRSDRHFACAWGLRKGSRTERVQCDGECRDRRGLEDKCVTNRHEIGNGDDTVQHINAKHHKNRPQTNLATTHDESRLPKQQAPAAEMFY